MNHVFRLRSSTLLLVAAMLVLLPSVALAHLNGFNIKDDQGTKSGTQALPGIYFGVPLHWSLTVLFVLPMKPVQLRP